VAGFVPGVISLLVVPALIYRLYPPEITHTPEAPELARERLREMGPMSRDGWGLLGVFVVLLTLWSFGGTLGVNATATALARARNGAYMALTWAVFEARK